MKEVKILFCMRNGTLRFEDGRYYTVADDVAGCDKRLIDAPHYIQYRSVVHKIHKFINSSFLFCSKGILNKIRSINSIIIN